MIFLSIGHFLFLSDGHSLNLHVIKMIYVCVQKYWSSFCRAFGHVSLLLCSWSENSFDSFVFEKLRISFIGVNTCLSNPTLSHCIFISAFLNLCMLIFIVLINLASYVYTFLIFWFLILLKFLRCQIKHLIQIWSNLHYFSRCIVFRFWCKSYFIHMINKFHYSLRFGHSVFLFRWKEVFLLICIQAFDTAAQMNIISSMNFPSDDGIDFVWISQLLNLCQFLYS